MVYDFLSTYTPNQISILRHIRQRGKLTRGELTEVSGFQLLTVTKTVARFLEDGLLIECGYEQSSGGRRAANLVLNPHFRYTLAADIGASGARIGVVGMDGSVIEQRNLSSRYIPARYITVQSLRDVLQELKDKYKNILGLGIGISGVVRNDLGKILYCPNISGWNDVDVIREFQEPLNIPTLVDTSARCMALAESTLGAGRGCKNQVCISIGNSVSAGIIIDGQIYRGGDGAAGEIGHTCVRSDNHRVCTCGNTGCLEMYVTLPMLKASAAQRLRDFSGYSPLRNYMGDQTRPTAAQLFQASQEGDKVAISVLEDCADTLSTTAGYLVNILNPDLIVLGGVTVENFPNLVDQVSQNLRRRGYAAIQRQLQIRRAELGWSSAMVGAALQVIDAAIGCK